MDYSQVKLKRASMLSKIGIAILVIALIDLVFLNYWILVDQRQTIPGGNVKLEEKRGQEVDWASPSPLVSPTPTAVDTKNSVKTVETRTVVEKEIQTIVQTAQKEIFIPIGSGSTSSHDYVDLAGLEVTIDTNKYSAIESVVFEASIWVQDGNGKMFTQLYNKTDKHPVWNSELSTNSATGTLTSSSKVVLDGGAKIYKVQAKTNLTSYAAHLENARIKITLK